MSLFDAVGRLHAAQRRTAMKRDVRLDARCGRSARLLGAGVVTAALLVAPGWTAAASAADFDPGPGTYTINTSTAPPTLTGPGSTNISGTVVNGVAVFSFGNVSIPSTVTVNAAGNLPVEIVATGAFSLAGTINASGTSATNFTAGPNPGGPGAGAGGVDGAHGGTGPGGGGVGSTSDDGGGGGGFGGVGAPGGADGGTAGSGGSVYGNLTAGLQGGSGGAGSTTGGGSVTGGGGGGGAIELSADVLSIPGGGQVLANGGAGAAGGFGASGGGSGGGIIVRADAMDVTGLLSAAGGPGGTGGCCGDGGGGGGGRILYEYGTLAASGTANVSGGGSGSVGGLGSGHASALAAGAAGVIATIQGAIVTIKPASAVTTTGAALNGLVDPNGTLTSYHFEYGPTTAYGSQVPASDSIVGADLSDHAVSQTIGGLAPGTTYHYRVVATDASGLVSRSADETFATAPAAGVTVSTLGSVATLLVHCQGTTGQLCAGGFSVTAHETTAGGSVIAVAAAKHRKPKRVTKQVLLGQGAYSVTGGNNKAITFRLNGATQRLLSRLGTLPATLAFTATSASAPAGQTIRFAYARIHPRISLGSRSGGGAVAITRLTVASLPKGGQVAVACAGRGCPFAHKTLRSRTTKVSLTTLLHKARLRPGARITLTITAPNTVTVTKTFLVTAKLKLAGHATA